MADLRVNHSTKEAWWPGIDYGTAKFTVVSIDRERKLIAVHRSGGIAYVDRVHGSASTRAGFAVYAYDDSRTYGNDGETFIINKKGVVTDRFATHIYELTDEDAA